MDSIDRLFSNIIYYEEIPVFDIDKNTEYDIFTCSYSGIHVFNICFMQTGVNGPDAIFLNINGKEFLRLSNNGTSDTKYLFNSIILNLKIGNIVSLRTSLSRIQSYGAYSSVVVYGL